MIIMLTSAQLGLAGAWAELGKIVTSPPSTELGKEAKYWGIMKTSAASEPDEYVHYGRDYDCVLVASKLPYLYKQTIHIVMLPCPFFF